MSRYRLVSGGREDLPKRAEQSADREVRVEEDATGRKVEVIYEGGRIVEKRPMAVPGTATRRRPIEKLMVRGRPVRKCGRCGEVKFVGAFTSIRHRKGQLYHVAVERQWCRSCDQVMRRPA